MKNVFSVLFLIVLITGVVIAGCAQPAPAPSPSPAPAPAPAAPKVIELSFTHHEPPVAASAKLYQEWADKIGEQTKGKVKITVYPAQSLVNLKDVWASVKGGVADIGLMVLAEEAKHLQLNNVMKQPSTLIPNGLPGLKVWEELYAKFPEMQAEFKDVKMLFQFTTSAAGVHTVDKEVHVPADVRGMKIVCPPGGSEIEFMRLAGASPVALPAPQWFTALERKLAQGLMAPMSPVRIFGLADVFKYHIDPSYGPNMLYTVMNIDKWNSLPPDVQKVFEDLRQPTSELLAKAKTEEENGVMMQLKGKGQIFFDLSPAEREQWNKTIATASDKWIKDTEAVGKPASKIYEEAVKLAKKYSQ